MSDAVFPPVELSEVGQESSCFHGICCGGECSLMHGDGIFCYLLKSYAPDGTHFRTEVCFEQTLTESDALENLRTTV